MPPSNDNIILKLYFTAKLQRALTRGTILWSLCRDKDIYINIYSTLTYTTLNPWATFLKSHPTGLQSFDWQQPLTLWKYKCWASRTKLIFSVSSGTILQYYFMIHKFVQTKMYKLRTNSKKKRAHAKLAEFNPIWPQNKILNDSKERIY